MKHNEDNLQKYNNDKNYETRVFNLDKSRIQKIIKIVNIKQNETKTGNILDIGCLSGKLLSKTKKTWKRYGIDIINKPKNFDENSVFIQTNVEKGIPFKNNFFNIIISGEVIEHLYDTDYFLEEIYRTLKIGGILIISTPNINSLTNRFLIALGKYPRNLEYKKGGAGHIHIYNSKTLSNQMLEKGFQIIKKKGNFLSIPDPTKNKIIRNSLFKHLGDIFPNLSENIIIVGIKNEK